VRYRAVFFDAGETILHPHPSFPELLSMVLAEQGHDGIDPEDIRARSKVVSERFFAAARAGQTWSTSPERSREFWGGLYRELLGEMGVAWSSDLGEALYATFTDVAHYRLFSDVEETLGALANDGYEIGLISNFEEWLELLLEHLGVTRSFEVRVISGVEGVEKPDPAIFRLALERAGVEASEAVYVGDSLEFDVEPATAVGMLGVLLDRRDRYPEATCPRIGSLGELRDLLARTEAPA
jgi:putative hydrolase of the HAD superfamily